MHLRCRTRKFDLLQSDQHVADVQLDGSWYYVAIPQGELRWFMDMNSTFGYVKKADVAVVGMACQLGWIN